MNIKALKFLVSLILLNVASASIPVKADSSRLKAAYLLNFARFVYWPDEVLALSESFNVCVIGYGQSDKNLNSLANEKILSKKIKVKFIREYKKDKQCHVVYIGENKKNSYIDIITKIENDTVLTVGDISGFAKLHGMIGFLQLNNKIRFEINLKRSGQSKIKYKSQLLEVAVSLR